MSATSYEEKEYWEDRYKTKWDDTFEWYNIRASHLWPLLSEAGVTNIQRLLDCGCGNSPLARDFVSKYGFTRVVACDYSEVCIQALQSSSSSSDVSYVLADCRELSSVFGPNSFDVVIDKATLDAISCGPDEDVCAYVRELLGVLVPGGILLVVTGGNPVEKRRDQLVNLSKGRLVCEKMVEMSRDGPAAMTALVLRKMQS